MGVYWRTVKNGQNLIFSAEDDGNEERVGGYRETKRGIDAYAATFGYEPGRSQKGFETIEDAKAFVESFRPWELYGAEEVTVESEVRPGLDSVSAGTSDTLGQPEDTTTPEQPSEIATQPRPDDTVMPNQPVDTATRDEASPIATPERAAESMAAESQPPKRWWEFWKDR